MLKARWTMTYQLAGIVRGNTIELTTNPGLITDNASKFLLRRSPPIRKSTRRRGGRGARAFWLLPEHLPIGLKQRSALRKFSALGKWTSAGKYQNELFARCGHLLVSSTAACASNEPLDSILRPSVHFDGCAR